LIGADACHDSRIMPKIFGKGQVEIRVNARNNETALP